MLSTLQQTIGPKRMGEPGESAKDMELSAILQILSLTSWR
jgi:hypothetical protein